VLPTAATGDLVAAIGQAEVSVPLAAVVLDQPESVRMLPRAAGEGRIPAYAYPEAAAAAMARAARYGAWRTEPRGQVPSLPDVSTEDARTLVREFFHATIGGGWMPPDTTAALLACYGIPLVGLTPAHSEDEAVGAFQTAAGPVVLKAGGTEVIVGVADDRVFGPLVVFGLGGVATDVLADHAARLTPLTDTDADRLIGSIRSAPLLRGHRGGSPADLGALRDLLLRVSRLADDLPEVAELDLNPVIARPDGAFVVDARIKVTPYQAQDPFLRRLR
jgi:acyl-CoA synthetase (NDP forming)